MFFGGVFIEPMQDTLSNFVLFWALDFIAEQNHGNEAIVEAATAVGCALDLWGGRLIGGPIDDHGGLMVIADHM